MRLTFILLLLSTASILGQSWMDKMDQSTELGQVHWLRSYEKAIEVSKQKELPILIFFQEVPGCHTCTSFGNEVMSHPMIVEIIESHFVPLAIFNNKGGADAAILQKYKEPSWNNPVIRIVNEQGKDIVDRHANAYLPGEVVKSLRKGMLSSGQLVPRYVDLLEEELNSEKKEAILSMYCFWTGEKEIGNLPGVLSTEAGYMNGAEVVKVNYNPELITYETLVSESAKKRCADRVFTDNDRETKWAENKEIPSQKTSNYRMDRDDKYYLSHTDYMSLPMLAIQATRANSLIAKRQNPTELLSPRQLELLALIQSKKVTEQKRANQDFIQSWSSIISQ